MQARQFSPHIKLQGGTDCLSQQYFAIINSIKKNARAMLLIFLSYQYYQKNQSQILWGNEGEGQ